LTASPFFDEGAPGDQLDDLVVRDVLGLDLWPSTCRGRALRCRRRPPGRRSCCGLIRITGKPTVGEPAHEPQHCSVCATPRAAVGSSRITTLEFQSTARAMATVCRWPPERLATFCRTDLTVRTDRPARVSAARCSMLISSRKPDDRVSRPRKRFWTMSRLSHSARS
jgi:hypothetical protein